LAGKDHNTEVLRLVHVADQSCKLLLGPYTIFLAMFVGQLVVRPHVKPTVCFAIIFRVKVTANMPEKRVGEPTANQRTILGMVSVPALTSILTMTPYNRLRVSYSVVAVVAMAIIFVQGTGASGSIYFQVYLTLLSSPDRSNSYPAISSIYSTGSS